MNFPRTLLTQVTWSSKSYCFVCTWEHDCLPEDSEVSLTVKAPFFSINYHFSVNFPDKSVTNSNSRCVPGRFSITCLLTIKTWTWPCVNQLTYFSKRERDFLFFFYVFAHSVAQWSNTRLVPRQPGSKISFSSRLALHSNQPCLSAYTCWKINVLLK